jgi:hypothetical protein
MFQVQIHEITNSSWHATCRIRGTKIKAMGQNEFDAFRKLMDKYFHWFELGTIFDVLTFPETEGTSLCRYWFAIVKTLNKMRFMDQIDGCITAQLRKNPLSIDARYVASHEVKGAA